MLALCAAAGSDVPLVCVMDDAQWLDAESLGVLAFVARRLTAEATAFIFGTRDCDGDSALAGVDELRLTGLDQRAAIELLAGVLPTGFDPFTAVQIAEATPWLQGLAQRCQALLASDADAARHHEAAIAHLCDADTPADLGRAHLLYGEWLRRRKRRREAREHLHKAIDIFETVKARMFADRALSELAATGEQISQREVVAGVPMTPREATVAKMAAAGATNADIAATLFVTANTVDYHLRKVFQKFGISSRRQLAERFNPAE
jgi:DNA-binding CsgD family transcriptional regulator